MNFNALDKPKPIFIKAMINDEGFLSPEIDLFEKNIEIEYSYILDKIKSYNIFFQQTAFEMKVGENDLVHWCLLALYIRALSMYQTIILISKKGIINEANILVRSLLEIQYIIIALSKYPILVKEYLGQEAIEMKRILKNSKKWMDKIPKKITLSEIENKLKDIEKEIGIHNLKKFTIKDFAISADLLLEYEINYGIFCLTGHSNIYDIKKHFVVDDKGIISSFNWGPNKNNLNTTLQISTETMFRILSSLRDAFQLDIEENFAKYFDDYNELRPKLETNN